MIIDRTLQSKISQLISNKMVAYLPKIVLSHVACFAFDIGKYLRNISEQLVVLVDRG